MAKKATRSRKTARAANDPCARIRRRVDMVEGQIQELQDFLPEAAPSQRPSIRAAIQQLRALLRQLLSALRACERNQ
jgi:predicted component of type VI protein secretion system